MSRIFLVELENSPMSIEVKDFELQRPTSRVTKPEKGNRVRQVGMMGGMMGGDDGSDDGHGRMRHGGMMAA